ncbi:efflux RND transporter periplasmic adaptor subunit [Labilibacter marinus]|uniref:efflux RND transporter periplasmic adaptor subunit n=1 Tax=Labilibacter marinus TaxID=1477105 RepID=UPI00082A9009|nr:efflux RND transporter periplasmic adaptor subunit [Labilibacter marinus]
MRKNTKLIRLTIAIASVIVIIIIYQVFKPNAYTESTIITKVNKGEFKSLVYSTGQLQAENSVSINVPNELGSRHINIYEIKVSKLIEEGTVVDSGDYVASLDHSAVEEKMSDALTSLTERLESYEDAKIDTNINLSNLRDNLVSAKIDVEEKDLVLKQSIYESPSVIRQATLDLDKAKRKLDQERRNYDLKKKQDVIKVNRAYKTVEKVQERIKDIEDLFEAIDIKAPAPGMLIYSFDRTGNKIRVGSMVNRWDPKIAELPDLTSMISKTFINEVDISKIQVGQMVKVGVDAFPEKEFDGEVIEVANIGQVIPGGDSKVFEVSIKVNGYDKDLRPAMTTVNEITTNTLSDVLYIPLEAVFQNDSLSYVYLEDKPDRKQIVKIGAENENHVVIEDGLKSGQVVLMNEPVSESEVPYAGVEIYEQMIKQDSLDVAGADSLSLTSNL